MLEYIVFVSKRVCDSGGYLKLQKIQINHGIHFNAFFNENEGGVFCPSRVTPAQTMHDDGFYLFPTTLMLEGISLIFLANILSFWRL